MSGQRILIVGGTGFVGRHLSARLQKDGHRVCVASRHPPGNQGPVSPVRHVTADVLDPPTLRAPMQEAETVINLVGAVSLPSAEAYFSLHEWGAKQVAEAAHAAGVKLLIHISALAVNEHAPAAADRSKAAGEAAVHARFPKAVILRPSLMFGEDDHLLNQFEQLSRYLPVIPLFGAGTLFQPLHVDDLCEAIARIILQGHAVPSTCYEMGGTDRLSLMQVVKLLLKHLQRHRWVLPLPFPLATALGKLLRLLPNPPFTEEQVALLKSDKTVTRNAAGLQDLGIQPKSLQAWLSQSRFDAD